MTNVCTSLGTDTVHVTHTSKTSTSQKLLPFSQELFHKNQSNSQQSRPKHLFDNQTLFGHHVPSFLLLCSLCGCQCLSGFHAYPPSQGTCVCRFQRFGHGLLLTRPPKRFSVSSVTRAQRRNMFLDLSLHLACSCFDIASNHVLLLQLHSLFLPRPAPSC